MTLSHPRFRPQRTIPERIAMAVPRWSAVRLSGVRHLPVVLGETVFASLEDGRLAAYKLPSWDLLWETPAPGAVAPWNLRFVATDAVLYFVCASVLFRCEPESGALSPVRPVNAECELNIDVLADGRLFRNASLVPGQMQLSCESMDAAQVWTSPLAPVMQWSACDGDVFLCSQVTGPLVAFDRADGRRLWEFREGIIGWPSLSEGWAFCAAENRVLCLDATTGKQLWSTEVPVRRPANLVLYADGKLYTMDGSYLCVIAAATGALLHSHSVEQACRRLQMYTPSDLLVTDGLAWTGDARSSIFAAFGVETGEAVWHTALASSLPYQNIPFAVGNELLVLGGNGDLLGFGEGAG